ncbi:OV-16 antigen [Ditylenchus destructor]|nr:OV-16 antigen [Ditylenchus destructor]
MNIKIIFSLFFFVVFHNNCVSATGEAEKEAEEMLDTNRFLQAYFKRGAKIPLVLEMTYANVAVKPGATVRNSTSMPHLKWNFTPNSQYTLMVLDTSPRQNLHWLVVNISGNNVSGGKILHNYIAPKPAIVYVVLIYLQNEQITEELESGPFDRRTFMELEDLGPLVAMNFFKV